MEVLGQNPRLLKSDTQTVDFYEEMWRTLKGGRSFRGTFINRTTDNRLIHCDEVITPLTNESDEVTHYVSIFRDLTTRVLEEQMFREMVRLDGLTGALTRSSGELALEKAFMQSRGSMLPMSIAMVDVDHFKGINDTYGHSTGDVVLKTVARSLIATLRANDSVVRWGGEEFLLIFSDCQLEKAIPLAQRCCSELEGIEHGKAGRVTVSIGVGQLQFGESMAQLIERVDQALYQAKRSGRNQVQISKPQAPSTL